MSGFGAPNLPTAGEAVDAWSKKLRAAGFTVLADAIDLARHIGDDAEHSDEDRIKGEKIRAKNRRPP